MKKKCLIIANTYNAESHALSDKVADFLLKRDIACELFLFSCRAAGGQKKRYGRRAPKKGGGRAPGGNTAARTDYRNATLKIRQSG